MKNPEDKSNEKEGPTTESPNTVLVVIDTPADTTPRPRSANIPLDWPRPAPPKDSGSQ
jgi:hypothetical protein